MTTRPNLEYIPELDISKLKHPCFINSLSDWTVWRDTYVGGDTYVQRYLKRYSEREDTADFNFRSELTVVPNHAKAVIHEIRNAIFQRMQDIIRTGGSDAYNQAVKGERGGVDRRGHSMTSFIGQQVIHELLVMGKYGVYVDMPEDVGLTRAGSNNVAPYIYGYRAENILNWIRTNPEEPSEFQAVLLEDTDLEYCPITGLPMGEVRRYRFVWIGPDGFVRVQFFDTDGKAIARDGSVGGGPIVLEGLTRIPFHVFDIGDSLLKDVARFQKALMNIESSNICYAIKSNFPMYVEQRDPRAVGAHLKPAASDGTATAGGQDSSDQVIKVGAQVGRTYPMNAERPGYIAPPSEPLEASFTLCDRLEQTIRKLVNLSVIQKGSASASGISKAEDREGLENGLAFIGLVLENGERQIASFWAAYENANPANRKVATIKYPDRYSLKDDRDRIDEASALSELIFKVPSNLAKREIAKLVVYTLMASKVSSQTLRDIMKEIDNSEYITSDPAIVIQAKEAGIVGDRLASLSMGYPENEYLVAREDHVDRLGRIAIAQGGLATAEGIDDKQVDPKMQNANEKELSRETDTEESTEEPTRGEGK